MGLGSWSLGFRGITVQGLGALGLGCLGFRFTECGCMGVEGLRGLGLSGSGF